MRWDSVRRPLALVMLVVPAYVALSGCSSGSKKTAGEQRSGAAVTSLKDTRAQLASGKAQIDKTISAMNAIRDGQGSLQAEFATFNEEIKKCDAGAERARARAADMRERSATYQQKWRDEMGKVDDPTLRAAATERANKVRDRFDAIKEKSDEVRAAYQPFIKQIKSVQTYLSNDLTPPGVQAATPVFDKATADGKVVVAKIDALIAELDDVASSMSPAAGTAETPPKK